MRAGRLHSVIIFDQPVSALGDWNEESLSFVPYFHTRGSVEPLRGNETFLTSQVNAELTTKIVTRWSPNLDGVTAKWRIRCVNPLGGFIVYNIGAPPVHTQLGQRELVFMCKSGLNQG